MGKKASSYDASRFLVRRSMRMAAGLALLKTAAGTASGSLSLLASALDSLMDLLTSAANYLSIGFSRKPADARHPYGHGKIEGLAGILQGTLILAGGLALLAEALRRLVSGAVLRHEGWGIAVMLVSITLSHLHGRRLREEAARTGSAILRAEGLHFSMDVLANLAVLLALGAARLGGGPTWDLGISALAGAYVVRESARLMAASLHELLDSGLPPAEHEELKALIRSHPRVAGYHNLRTRRAGARVFIDFHVVIEGLEGFREAHEAVETLIDRIRKRFPGADVTVHADPPGGR